LCSGKIGMRRCLPIWVDTCCLGDTVTTGSPNLCKTSAAGRYLLAESLPITTKKRRLGDKTCLKSPKVVENGEIRRCHDPGVSQPLQKTGSWETPPG